MPLYITQMEWMTMRPLEAQIANQFDLFSQVQLPAFTHFTYFGAPLKFKLLVEMSRQK